jgi:chromosome segregation ATPase
VDEGGLAPGPGGALDEQVQELFGDFQQNVATNADSFIQFMLWAAETDSVSFQDLLIATRSVYDIMGEEMPCDKSTWDGFIELANLVDVTTVSDSELEYALEVFSKTYDLYKAELRRLDEVRSEAEKISHQRISEEILAEDEGLLADLTEEEQEARVPTPVELERWDKLVDDTRSQINSTKAEFDELVDELTPSKAERDAAISRLRVLEKDSRRKRSRLERYQRGRISEAKAEEIQNLERELVRIEDQEADWSSRLAIAQERIDERNELCHTKLREFSHIKREVVSLIHSLSSPEREAVEGVLAEELADLDDLIADVERWLEELAVESAHLPDDSTAIMEATPPVTEEIGPSVRDEEAIDVEDLVASDIPMESDEPPIVFKDSEVRRMLAELPIERPPQDELLLRIESLQQELMNRENAIMKLEHTIGELMEEKDGSSTVVELERNKYKLELNKTQDELVEKQDLLEQYLDVIKTLEGQMEIKDRELRETLALNRRKTAELRQKESALEAMDHELVEKQEEFRSERQELQDREARLNSQISERETQEREIAKKDLTLELRNEQIRKKMDRLSARELDIQRVTSQQKELEEMLTLKERELQNLKTELDVREDELRRREAAIEERSVEAKKLQSEVSKMEHRVRSRDETLRRREARADEDEERIGRLEAAIADREVRLEEREGELNLREAKADAALSSLDSQRDEIDTTRRATTKERQETERLRIALEHRHDELIRREDQLSARETTLRERERATQIREERLGLERTDLEQQREEFGDQEVKWAAKEKMLLEQLASFNNEKQELVDDWKASKKRTRELELENAELTGRLISAESSLMTKDSDILALAHEVEEAKGRPADEVGIEVADGVRVSLKRIMEDVERQRAELEEIDARSSKVEMREKELVEMEEILNSERERVRELLTEQERGQTDLKEAMDDLVSRTSKGEELDKELAERQKAVIAREEAISSREESVRQREREMERLTTAVEAEARAEDREEELTDLQKQLEERTASLEAREEELERTQTRLNEERTELERQKGELMMAREARLKTDDELEEIPPPEIPELDEQVKWSRAPSGLAVKAAEMAAAKMTEDSEKRKPIARLRCKVCRTVIPIYTEERPLDIACPSCGKEGILK